MEILSKSEAVSFLNCHERTICYHIKKGNLEPIKVRGRKFMFNNTLYDLPEKYNNHTKLIFLKDNLLQLFK